MHRLGNGLPVYLGTVGPVPASHRSLPEVCVPAALALLGWPLDHGWAGHLTTAGPLASLGQLARQVAVPEEEVSVGGRCYHMGQMRAGEGTSPPVVRAFPLPRPALSQVTVH